MERFSKPTRQEDACASLEVGIIIIIIIIIINSQLPRWFSMRTGHRPTILSISLLKTSELYAI